MLRQITIIFVAVLVSALETDAFIKCLAPPGPFAVAFTSKGFGKSSQGVGQKSAKSYDDGTAPIKDLIDTESAMNQFFSSNEEWKPLFHSILEDRSVPAMSFLGGFDSPFDFDENSKPWKKLGAIPSDEADRKVLASVLDSMQQVLMEMPVDERTKEDQNDINFIEEGRRMLMLSRFHVLQGTESGSIENYDTLFATCWSEILFLKREDSKNSGSLIVVPGSSLADLRRFADMNLQRPLQWLGLDRCFEVASLERGSPAIRLIHKLSDIPDDIPEDPEE